MVAVTDFYISTAFFGLKELRDLDTNFLLHCTSENMQFSRLQELCSTEWRIKSGITLRAIVSPEDLWRTLQTTPPFPAPSSWSFSKSSLLSSPIVCFCERNCSSRFRCSVSRSSSFSFLTSASRFRHTVVVCLWKKTRTAVHRTDRCRLKLCSYQWCNAF